MALALALAAATTYTVGKGATSQTALGPKQRLAPFGTSRCLGPRAVRPYSLLSALIGSMLAALRAGIQIASIATDNSTRGTVVKATASIVDVP